MIYPPLPLDRNLRGYHGAEPKIRWPNGAQLAVSVVVNIEEGAELSIAAGDASNEFIYEAIERVESSRDLCMESHYAYGTRRGWARIRNALKSYGVTATLNACGRSLYHSPWIASEAAADGHEISSHGWRWERQATMSEAEEREVIAKTVAALSAAAGTPPVGWNTGSSASVATRRLLVEHGGFLYDSNAYDDDVPYVVTVKDRPHVVLPYAFDTNDMRFFGGRGFVHAEDFARYCIAAFDRLYAEGERQPRMISIGLHLRIIGRPARIGGLEQVLEHMSRHAGVWFARRDEIAHAWRAGIGLPPWTPADRSAG